MHRNSDSGQVLQYGPSMTFILIGVAAVLGAAYKSHSFFTYYNGWLAILRGFADALMGIFLSFIFI